MGVGQSSERKSDSPPAADGHGDLDTSREDSVESYGEKKHDPDSDNSTDQDTAVVCAPQQQCKFRVLLHNTINETVKERMISTHGYPSCGQTIKQAVEEQLDIPACVQTIKFGSLPISDTTSPSRLRVREEDVFDVHYPSEADVSYLSDLIATLTRILSVLQTAIASLSTSRWISSATQTDLNRECHEFVTDTLPLKYFSVFPTGAPNSNQLYFIEKGGLALLLQIYSTVHRLPWHRLPYDMQKLEYSCLKIIWNFSATLGIRQLILRQNIIDEVFKSLMRTKIKRYSAVSLPGVLADISVSESQSLHVLAETVYSALVITGK